MLDCRHVEGVHCQRKVRNPCFRAFSEFVPYALRHNLAVPIPLLKNSVAFNFFLREASILWNSLTLENKSSPSHANFMNHLKSYYHVAKYSALHLLGVNPRLTSVRYMLRFAYSPLNINKNLIVSERGCWNWASPFFYSKFHDAAQAILCDNVCNIL